MVDVECGLVFVFFVVFAGFGDLLGLGCYFVFLFGFAFQKPRFKKNPQSWLFSTAQKLFSFCLEGGFLMFGNLWLGGLELLF